MATFNDRLLGALKEIADNLSDINDSLILMRIDLKKDG
jgi:hypothetical protein